MRKGRAHKKFWIINSWCFYFCVLKEASDYYPLGAFGIILTRTDERSDSKQIGKHFHSFAHLSFRRLLKSMVSTRCNVVCLYCQWRCEIKQKYYCCGWKQHSFINRKKTKHQWSCSIFRVSCSYHVFMDINLIIKRIIYTQTIWERLLWFSNQTIASL